MHNLIKRELRLVETTDPLPAAAVSPANEPVATAPASPPSVTDMAAIVAAAKAAAMGHHPAPRHLTCLVVDDSRMIRKVARRIMEQYGFAVSEAENGQEAIARCRSAMPDLVLTDWDMPVMTGPEFVAALRGLPGSADTRVVFCTSKSGALEIHHGIAAGADDWIVKPFDENTLGGKLAALGFV
ncbi:MAG: response regulator [Sphingomonadaceae bacterium]